MAEHSKVTDRQFWTILRENGGLFARTARAIAKQFNIEYSRQAVADRANKKPELLLEIAEENVDVAEEGLHSIMRKSEDRVKLDAIKFYLKTMGKKRGYIEKSEHDMTSNGQTMGVIYLPQRHELETNTDTDESTTA